MCLGNVPRSQRVAMLTKSTCTTLFVLSIIINPSHTVILLLQVISCCTARLPVGVPTTGCHGNTVYQWVVLHQVALFLFKVQLLSSAVMEFV